MGKKSAKDNAKDAARSDALRQDIDFVEHTWELDKLYSHFGTSLEHGLSDEQVLVNRDKYGPNELTPVKSLPWWMKFLLQFANFFAGLLLAGGVLCFVSYAIDQSDPANLYLGIVLFGVVTITAIFSYLQESKSDALMEGFKNMIPRKCQVIRSGKLEVLEAKDLVPGDVVKLEDGQQVPADVRVLVSQDLKVDNSSLTGESEPVERSNELLRASDGTLISQPLESNNLCFYTTIVNSGSGTGCVIGTGDRTVMGQIAGLTVSTSNEQTPIRKEITRFIYFISVVAVTLGIAFLVMGFVLSAFKPVENIVFCIGIIVANVPEGLLATVTVSLALTAKRMHQKNVLVKNLEAVETLGSTTVIASDKTGTLTQNRMTVQHCWYSGEIRRCPAARNLPQLAAILKAGIKGETMIDVNDPAFKALAMVGTICNNSAFVLRDPLNPDAPSINMAESMQKPDFNLLAFQTTGDASESGLTKFVQTLRDVDEYRAAMPKLFEIKFNSTNKWQLSIHKPEAGSGVESPVLVLKGAPERVLHMCKTINVGGEEVPFDAAWEARYTEAYETLGGMGERVLGFAYKRMDGYPMDHPFVAKPEPNFPLDDLCFAGLFSLIDPPKEGVPEAVAKCKRARIKVFMVTGDHPITAQAIAKQVGIIDQEKWDSGDATVVKGDDIREWMELEGAARDAKFDHALSHEQIVWARVSPAHKLLIVENAQRRGEVVAVTGDGVNDAPALKKGDIGVAMGIAGKDVSKDAADMILLDDNFASIVNGVEEGRLIFDNLKKSISYTLTSNIPEIAPFLAFILIQIPLPLSTVLILCVDLGTDMVPAISLAHETREADIMDRPPRNSATDRLVNRRLITFAYLQIGVIQAAAGFFAYMVVLQDYGYTPSILMFTGVQWDEWGLLCNLDSNLRPEDCGYGCGSPEDDDGSLFKTADDADNGWCTTGCAIPFPGSNDPFTEYTSLGFRGFTELPATVGGVSLPADLVNDKYDHSCARTCAWYTSLGGDLQTALVDYSNTKINDELVFDDPLAYVLTAQDAAGFEEYCALDGSADFGFPGRGRAASKQQNANAGAFYWWNGERQFNPNPEYQEHVLAYAQTSYFVCIVVVQWADLIISKTRKLSVFEQGMHNKMMNFGLVFETVLALLLVYVPFLNTGLGTRPLHVLHWFVGFPWSMMIFIYDEVRKMLMRRDTGVGRWLNNMTYW